MIPFPTTGNGSLPYNRETTMPKILNRKHSANWSTDDAVYVGRPTKFGNPFIVNVDGTREEVIEKYRVWLLGQPKLLLAVKVELIGRDLVCWCAPLPCHASVLMEIANDL